MNMKGLKHKKMVWTKTPSLNYKERFIYLHGWLNCVLLKFKDANTIIKIMDAYDVDCLEKEDKKFILKHSNKEVLVYLCNSDDQNPDIFVFGDDSIAFRVSCFV